MNHEATGAPVVVKLGGNAMVDPGLLSTFAHDIAALRNDQVPVVVVHGGGPQIQRLLDDLGIESTFTAGLRVTSLPALRAVRMALVGEVGRDVATALYSASVPAAGVSGEDDATLLVRKHMPLVDGSPVDIGWVGEVADVNTGLIEVIMSSGRVPVVSSIGIDIEGASYNVNADAAAGAIAAALGASALIMMTNVPGVYRDWPKSSDIFDALSLAELAQLLPRMDGGMIPKLDACRNAVAAGVARASIIDGRIPGVVRRCAAGEAVGTTIRSGVK